MKALLGDDKLSGQLIGSYKTSHSVKFEFDLQVSATKHLLVIVRVTRKF
jgi:hypothetical protein